MKIYISLATLICVLGSSLNAQETELTQTPDVIGDDALDAIPPELQQTNPLGELDAQLMASAYQGRADAVNSAIAKGANVNVSDNKKRTPLMLAASNGHLSAVEILVANGADVNSRDSDGQTALMYAAKRSFNDTATYLLENQADVNVQSKKKGITALMLAAVSDNVDLVQSLLEHGADAEVVDSLGRSARLLAEKKGNSRVVALLPDAVEQGGKER